VAAFSSLQWAGVPGKKDNKPNEMQRTRSLSKDSEFHYQPVLVPD
jgi:hypothetical protein